MAEDQDNLLTLRHPQVYNLTVQAAAAHVRRKLAPPTTTLTPDPHLLPTTITISLLDLFLDSDDSDDDPPDELDDEPPFIVQVAFIKEILGWSSAVYKVRVTEASNQQPPETWAVKIRTSQEKPDADASNARAYGTMLGVWHVYPWLCPEPLHYVKTIPKATPLLPALPGARRYKHTRHTVASPSGRISTPGVFNNQHRSLRQINNATHFVAHSAPTHPHPSLSALLCTWVEGFSLHSIGTNMQDKKTKQTWSRFVHLRRTVAKIKKPKQGATGKRDRPKYTKWLAHIVDCNDHELWLKNLHSRVSGLVYLYESKAAQDLIPQELLFLNEVDAQTGLLFLNSMEYRLNACLTKLQALKRDDEDTQDLCLFIGDPSLANVVWNPDTFKGIELVVVVVTVVVVATVVVVTVVVVATVVVVIVVVATTVATVAVATAVATTKPLLK